MRLNNNYYHNYTCTSSVVFALSSKGCLVCKTVDITVCHCPKLITDAVPILCINRNLWRDLTALSNLPTARKEQARRNSVSLLEALKEPFFVLIKVRLKFIEAVLIRWQADTVIVLVWVEHMRQLQKDAWYVHVQINSTKHQEALLLQSK